MQRQLLERERLAMTPLGHSAPTSLHPSLLAQHQQEYLRSVPLQARRVALVGTDTGRVRGDCGGGVDALASRFPDVRR